MQKSNRLLIAASIIGLTISNAYLVTGVHSLSQNVAKTENTIHDLIDMEETIFTEVVLLKMKFPDYNQGEWNDENVWLSDSLLVYKQ